MCIYISVANLLMESQMVECPVVRELDFAVNFEEFFSDFSSFPGGVMVLK